jgi:hypothetical protein
LRACPFVNPIDISRLTSDIFHLTSSVLSHAVVEAYEQSHNIPPLASTIAKRVTEMRKGKK